MGGDAVASFCNRTERGAFARRSWKSRGDRRLELCDTLGFALVYLGEHYVTDLVAGALLVTAVRRGEPLAEPLVRSVNGSLRRLERLARG